MGLPVEVVDGSHREGYVVLDRVADIAQRDTPYCIHGRATCVSCGQFCWLGSRSYDDVRSGRLAPLCLPCAQSRVPAGTPVTRGAADHRRADGPHEH